MTLDYVLGYRTIDAQFPPFFSFDSWRLQSRALLPAICSCKTETWGETNAGISHANSLNPADGGGRGSVLQASGRVR